MTLVPTTSRGYAGYAYGALAGIVSASLLVLSDTYSSLVFLSFFALIPLYMVGLGAGTVAVCIAAVVGAAAMASKGMFYGADYLVTEAVPAVVFVYIALRHTVTSDAETKWGSIGNLITGFAVYPCIVFLFLFAVTVHQGNDLVSIAREMMAPFVDQISDILKASGEPMTPELKQAMQKVFDIVVRIAPAFEMFAWMLLAMASMFVAQIILRKKNWNLRPELSLAQLHVPTGVIFAAAISGIVAFFAPAPYDYVGLNLALVLGVPFFLVGLVIVHAWAAQTRMPLAVLVVFYLSIVFVSYPVPLVALLGAIDPWVDFRKRFAERLVKQGEKK